MKPENPPAPRDERQEARILAHEATIFHDVRAVVEHKVKALVSLIDSVCEQRDGRQADAKNYAANVDHFRAERDSLKEQLNEKADALLSQLRISALMENRIEALKEQLAGAHAQGCGCHELQGTETHERMEWVHCNHPHPYVDPRCAEMRKGKP